MKSTSTINQALNLCLKDQLTAINQFFLHARIARHWGLEQLNDYEYKRSIKAMKLADDLIERILFLEGLPNLQDLDKIYIGETVDEIIRSDETLLGIIHQHSKDAIALCEQHNDYLSRELLEKIQSATEDHLDWIETQQWLIAGTGVENYIQSQI